MYVQAGLHLFCLYAKKKRFLVTSPYSFVDAKEQHQNQENLCPWDVFRKNFSSFLALSLTTNKAIIFLLVDLQEKKSDSGSGDEKKK